MSVGRDVKWCPLSSKNKILFHCFIKSRLMTAAKETSKSLKWSPFINSHCSYMAEIMPIRRKTLCNQSTCTFSFGRKPYDSLKDFCCQNNAAYKTTDIMHLSFKVDPNKRPMLNHFIVLEILINLVFFYTVVYLGHAKFFGGKNYVVRTTYYLVRTT